VSEVIDAIEILGAAIERDRIDPATAAGIVVDASEGGLDLAAAADWLRHWRTARAIALDLPGDAR
jgi:hypothetical protein